MEKDYDEEVEEIEDDYSHEETTEEEKEQREIEKEQSTQVRKGQVEFKYVNHSERAVKKFKRVSDGDTTKYVNIALEYFGHRCALSGERFETFDKKVDGKKSNLSAEHVVALCLGGDDIVPNLVPTVLQYNLRKNGYYLLDYWDKQKDIDGKSLYSPYRLLKLVNYMMKSIDARDLKTVKEYRKTIMTPNEIDEFLAEIERQDELESDNSKKKIYSDTITATTVDEDNKKMLTEVPQVEGNIPTQREQQERFRQNEIDMMDIFLSDAVGLLNRTEELKQVRLQDKDGNEISLQDKLNDMLKSTIGVIPFEVEVRNAILEKLEVLGIQNNKYSVANDVLNNTPILEMANEKRENLKLIVENYVENQLSRIRGEQILSEEQLKTAISSMPTVLYDEKEMNKIRLWSTYRSNSFEELISRNYTSIDEFIDVFVVLKTNRVDLSKMVQNSKIEDLIKEKDKKEQNKIINELQEISTKITKDWPIGTRLSTQKTRNMDGLIKEIEKAGIILTPEEKQKLLEKESNKEESERKTKELVQVLLLLKKYKIDLSEIVQGGENPSIIEELIKEKNEEEKDEIISELQKINCEITKDWPIGTRLSTQKTRNMNRLIKEINELGLKEKLNDKELKILLEKEGRKEEGERKTKELVQVLLVLKEYKIDLSKIVQGGENPSIIEELIKEKNEEEKDEIISKLQKINYEITKDWPIGVMLRNKKSRNMAQLIKEINELGLKEKLNDKELKILIEKERRKEESERKTKELVQVLLVLKKYKIDLMKITLGGKNSSIVEDLIKEKNEEEKDEIISELQKINYEITKAWSIGMILKNQKKRNIGQLKKEIENEGLELTPEEQQKILEKSAKKKVKETVVEQKNKGEISQNQQIEEDVFEDIIKQAEQSKESEASVR